MSDTDLIARLSTEFLECLLNDYGKENFDEHRFGKFQRRSLREKIARRKRRGAIPAEELKAARYTYEFMIAKYAEDFEFIYRRLEESSRELFRKLILYRALGYRRVMLPRNDSEYWEAFRRVRRLKDTSDRIDPRLLHFVLEKFDVSELGYDIKLYFVDLGIVVDFIFEQYAHKIGGKTIVQAEVGDTVIDCGGCWGDTALYFAHKVGAAGKVLSFEFIPNNVNLFNTNVNLNPTLRKRITLVEHPVWETSDKPIFYQDLGPGSAVSLVPLANQTGGTTTLSVDDFVEREKLLRVDYIKMDIEGAEPSALKGALNTIKKHRPKLAIAIYHSAADFVNIPKWLMELGLGYKFYLGHYTIHAEETVLFAAPA